MTNFDQWLLPKECKHTGSNMKPPSPDWETRCFNCNAPITDDEGKPFTSYDAEADFDPEWNAYEWIYWHEVCP